MNRSLKTLLAIRHVLDEDRPEGLERSCCGFDLQSPRWYGARLNKKPGLGGFRVIFAKSFPREAQSTNKLFT